MTYLEAVEAAKKFNWANWVAMDANGDWYAYHKKPYINGYRFYPDLGRSGYIGRTTSQDWEKSLTMITLEEK
jgi:hypothetical protein